MKKSLITGANGHLGYNLTRLLCDEGLSVKAGIRNMKNREALDKLGCEVAHVDIMDKDSMSRAFEGVSDVYAVGAAFRMWAKNPKKEIYDKNVAGTRLLFETARSCGVRNIVYISSIAALDFSRLPAREANGYNKDRRNWYYNSKNDSDKLALELGRKFGIRTVVLLPSTMIGGEVHKLSYSNKLVWQIVSGEVPVDTNISVNWIDVRDVALACLEAMRNGRNGERYILANEKHTTIQDSIRVARKLYPEAGIPLPKKLPKPMLYGIATLMELGSKLTGKEPLLQREYLDMFYGLKQDFDISKARKELDFRPTPSNVALRNALRYLKEDWKGAVV
ncbi:hypothetical protein FUAX_01580 [Fulvitalea axinellae]|uniref:NAD-dependent epimerase/dehydratase domain-containing protein n=1 Tax=Fulvitalea axinellae TaxID=1182444 RepID=A0AAU9CG23_9BACT|nr:hypothetical protein FUAX_01580 [Fulvitalea axinellae]